MDHPMEQIVEPLEFNGISVQGVCWAPTLWCGFSSFAEDSESEPEVEASTEKYRNLPFEQLKGKEAHWDACLSFNYLSAGKTRGMMYAFPDLLP